MIKSYGLYIVDDTFFSKYDRDHKLMLNKNECRPHYCGIISESGIIWLVPLSTQIDKYQRSISNSEAKHGKGKCIFYHIGRIKGEERVFLIGDAFPCTEEYIKKPFTIAGVPYVIQNQKDIAAVQQKLSRFIALVRNGRLHPNANIMNIEKSLLKNL